jgi:hypothetical protein
MASTIEQDKDYEREALKLEAELRPLLTDEFLATLVKAGQTHGNSGDWVEIQHFIGWCFSKAGKPAPIMAPFQD